MTITRPKAWFNVVKNDAGQWYWDFFDRYNVRWAVSGQMFTSKEAALQNVKKFRELTMGAAINAAILMAGNETANQPQDNNNGNA